MKLYLSKIIPKNLLSYRRRLLSWKKLKEYYLQDAKRFFKATYGSNEQETKIGLLTMAVHSIEKGFTMPDFRYGFGYKKLEKYLPECIAYVKQYGIEDVQIQHIAQTISDYKTIHDEAGYALPEDIAKNIDRFLNLFNGISSKSIQIDCTSDSFFYNREAPFPSFSNSRHSCRYYTGDTVPMKGIIDSVKLAQNAPSACNRQPVRLYIVSDKKKIQDVISIQKGNRGFGQVVDKLIVVCSYLGCYLPQERNCAFIDGGIFTMNLAYALHYNSIGACILNWCVDSDSDNEIRRIIPIRDSETVCCLLSCGMVPDKFKVCRSEKKLEEQIVTII
ncbi:MAG: nitroreductase family protein [Bacteroidales bacterium]|nr:nitroreductase family protein [Bacteroidales bacterium]